MGWCIWTAILVAMPYGVWNFGPMVPGQIDMGAFSLAVILVVIAGLLEPCFGEEKKHALVHLHVILVRLGWVATAGLVIAESYAFVRGFDGLITEEQVTLNENMSIVEFACGALAVSCWGVSALGDGICKGAPSRKSVFPARKLVANGMHAFRVPLGDQFVSALTCSLPRGPCPCVSGRGVFLQEWRRMECSVLALRPHGVSRVS